MEMDVHYSAYDKERVLVCPKCNKIMNGAYLMVPYCPSCGCPLSESNFVNWVNKVDDYEIAKTIVEKKIIEKKKDGLI